MPEIQSKNFRLSCFVRFCPRNNHKHHLQSRLPFINSTRVIITNKHLTSHYVKHQLKWILKNDIVSGKE